jgi:hypothetical protein
MINIVTGKAVNFVDFKFDENTLSTAITNFEFKNGRPITKSMLTWWAFNNELQSLPIFNTPLKLNIFFAKRDKK